MARLRFVTMAPTTRGAIAHLALFVVHRIAMQGRLPPRAS
jgi:hypothetical protein